MLSAIGIFHHEGLQGVLQVRQTLIDYSQSSVVVFQIVITGSKRNSTTGSEVGARYIIVYVFPDIAV